MGSRKQNMRMHKNRLALVPSKNCPPRSQALMVALYVMTFGLGVAKKPLA